MYIYMATYCTVLRYIEGDTCTKMRGRENVAFVNRGKNLYLCFVSYLH